MTDLVRYHTERGDESCKRVALVRESRKWLHVLVLAPVSKGKLSVWKVAKEERKYMEPLTLGKNKRPYPLSRALKGYSRLAKANGITKAAKRFLTEVRNELKKGKEATAPTGGDA